MCLLFLSVSYAMHLCLAPLFNAMSWMFILHLWLAFLTCPSNPIVLRLCFSFCLAPCAHCFLAPWSYTLISFALHFYSYYIQNKYFIFALFLKSLSQKLVCLQYVLHHQFLRLSLVSQLCLASLIFFIFYSQLQCLPLYLPNLSFTFVLPLRHLCLHLWLACLIVLHSMCFTIIL